MANNSVTHVVLSISTPGSNVFPEDRVLTAGLARLLNEWLVEASELAILYHPSPSGHRRLFSDHTWRAALYPTSQAEYYFETARSMLDLTLTQSFVNFTSLCWIFSHCGGAFPSVEDRALKLQPTSEVPAQAVYGSRY